ncbi:MAG: serine protein kinase PrkA, partial [Deltaproteobacteria bacterium]|nr:serine protein kinase PrkA [Deltaproteobacteria bacterium]
MDSNDFIKDISSRISRQFSETKRVISFQEYLDLIRSRIEIHTRSAAKYLCDCFDYFGREGKRFNLFDLRFSDGHGRLVGHEEVQESFYNVIRKFANEGKVTQLIFMHGPNGSAKSTFAACVAKAVEYYSMTDQGAIYKFNWIFPSEKIKKGHLGFGGESAEKIGKMQSYAYLPEEEIEARLPCTMKDHPLYLLPTNFRLDFLKGAGAREGALPEWLLYGDLSPMNRKIFDILLVAYNGDIERVYQHIQVERLFVSARYRRGFVTVEPQIQVDAGLRQITMNRAFESLPKVLQNINLFEPFGDLVDANRGIIEYNDLLKKPLETFKYLLATCEKSSVALPGAVLYLDLIFTGSSNDKHLRAFMEYPDWSSFKGRMELVRVPYLRNYLKEKEIYDDQVTAKMIGKHIAPHTSLLAALFAVLTRMVRPDASRFPPETRDIIGGLPPLDKAELYATGKTPSGLTIEQANELRACVEDLLKDGAERENYEGQSGASPREIKAALFNAAHDERFACLSPLALFEELESLIKEKTIYEFLRIEPTGDYFDYSRFIIFLRNRYLDIIDDEVRSSMGLVSEEQYLDQFVRYVKNIKCIISGEKLINPVTGEMENPDTRFTDEMEKIF